MKPLIEVSPGHAFTARRRLFDVVAQALDVRVVGTGEVDREPAARIVLDGGTPDPGAPALVLGHSEGTSAGDSTVRLTRSAALDVQLRGWEIQDERIASAATLPGDGHEVLATVGGRPVWTSSGSGSSRFEAASLVPQELGAAETLRSRFVPGRFFELLPLIQFLRSVSSERWTLPPTMAAFIMDDPNLHAGRYGYLDFGEMATRASHLTVATIPFDRWFTHSGTAQLFRDNPATLSLMIHGNNHTRHELADGRPDDDRLRMLAQSLNRSRALARTTGVRVAEVMAAPHGRCSEESSWDMARLGFESLCITRPFPWLPTPPATHPLAGWAPADTSSATPVVPRFALTATDGEVPLRAFLGQPIIVFGHHWDLRDMPTALDDWTARIARLGDVRWASVGEISRSLFSTRTVGETLLVQPHTRRVDVTVPEGTTRLRVETPTGPGYELTEMTTGHHTSVGSDEPLVVVPGDRVTIRLRAGESLDPNSVPSPRWSPWPPTRRLLVEVRDRTRPTVDAIRR